MGKARGERRQHLGMAEMGEGFELERDRVGRQAAPESSEQRHHLRAEAGIHHQQARRRAARLAIGPRQRLHAAEQLGGGPARHRLWRPTGKAPRRRRSRRTPSGRALRDRRPARSPRSGRRPGIWSSPTALPANARRASRRAARKAASRKCRPSGRPRTPPPPRRWDRPDRRADTPRASHAPGTAEFRRTGRGSGRIPTAPRRAARSARSRRGRRARPGGARRCGAGSRRARPRPGRGSPRSPSKPRSSGRSSPASVSSTVTDSASESRSAAGSATAVLPITRQRPSDSTSTVRAAGGGSSASATRAACLGPASPASSDHSGAGRGCRRIRAPARRSPRRAPRSGGAFLLAGDDRLAPGDRLRRVPRFPSGAQRRVDTRAHHLGIGPDGVAVDRLAAQAVAQNEGFGQRVLPGRKARCVGRDRSLGPASRAWQVV